MKTQSKSHLPFCHRFGVPHVGVGELQSGNFAAVVWFVGDISPQMIGSALESPHEAQAAAYDVAHQIGGVM